MCLFVLILVARNTGAEISVCDSVVQVSMSRILKGATV
jgi:hypothetical protein